jgi:hypothetical protein
MDADSLKRLLVTVIGFGLMALNKKLGLDLSDIAIASISTFLAAYVVQSGLKAAAKIKADAAAAAVSTPSAADKVLGSTQRVILFLLVPALLLGLARPAFAQDTGGGSPGGAALSTVAGGTLQLDAPENLSNVSITVVKAGQAVPFDGRCVTDQDWVAIGKRVAASDAKVEFYEAQWSPPWWALLAAGAVGLGAGAYLGVKLASK